MCLTVCGNVLNRFLKPSNVKEVEEVPLFLSEKFLPVSFTNAGVVASVLCSPPTMAQKSTVHEYFQRWSKAGVLEKIFRILLTEYGEQVGIDAR